MIRSFAPGLRWSWAGHSSAAQIRRLTTDQDISILVKELKARRLPIIVEQANLTNSKLLDATLDFLDLPPQEDGKEWFSPGRQLVHFAPVINSSDLLEDGTDMLHAPDKSFKYRLWAGGSLRRFRQKVLRIDRKVALVEKIGDVKVRGEKVFVQIRRAVLGIRKLGQIMDDLKPLNEGIDSTGRIVEQIFGPQGLGQKMDPQVDWKPRGGICNDIIMEETRWLCFMREKPPPPPVTESPRPPPDDVFHQVTFTTTPAMLFRFSALTFNAHAIHIDPEYTKNVYGLPDLLVHGPLTFNVLTQFANIIAAKFNSQQTQQESPVEPGTLKFQSIEYKNLAPIFVREQLTVGSTEPTPVEINSSSAAGAPPVATGDISIDTQPPPEPSAAPEKPPLNLYTSTLWISKPTRDGHPTVCVSATVRFVFESAQQKKERRIQEQEQESALRARQATRKVPQPQPVDTSGTPVPGKKNELRNHSVKDGGSLPKEHTKKRDEDSVLTEGGVPIRKNSHYGPRKS